MTAGDQLSFSFGDPAAAVHAMARIRVRDADDGSREAAGLLLVAVDGVMCEARSLPTAPAGSGWQAGDLVVDGGGEDGAPWIVRASGAAPLELVFAPVHDPLAIAGGQELLGRVTGTVAGVAVDAVGQLGRRPTPARPPARWRELDAWPAPGLALIARAAAERPAPHGEEALEVTIVEGEPPTAVSVLEPRLSTAYDGEQRPRRVGLELWEHGESERARRLAGETIAVATMEDGERLVHVAFLQVHIEGRHGAGRYEVAHTR